MESRFAGWTRLQGGGALAVTGAGFFGKMPVGVLLTDVLGSTTPGY